MKSQFKFDREVLVMEAIKDYVAHLDNKKRITLRGAMSLS